MQTIQLLADARRLLRVAPAARSRPAAASRSRSPPSSRPTTARRRCPRPTSATSDGWTYISQPVAIRVQRRPRRDRADPPDRRPDGERTSTERPDPALRRHPRRARRGGRRPRARGRGAAPHPRDARARRLPGGDLPWLTVLRVCALYPDLMNIYADRGNLALLRKRCEWRGSGVRARAASGLGDALDPDAHDLFYIGGGQDRDQALCAEDLATVKRDALHAAAAAGKVIFAVCGGYQLLGHGYELGGERASRRRARRPRDRARGRPAADRQRRDRGRPRRRARASSPASRTTAAARASAASSAHSAASFAVTATTAAPGSRASAAAARNRRRHLPARPAAAQEQPGSPTG